MFIDLEIILSTIIGFLFFIFIVVPAVKPLFAKRWEDKQLEEAKSRQKRAQKLLKAAELEAKALKTEIKIDKVIDDAFKH